VLGFLDRSLQTETSPGILPRSVWVAVECASSHCEDPGSFLENTQSWQQKSRMLLGCREVFGRLSLSPGQMSKSWLTELCILDLLRGCTWANRYAESVRMPYLVD